MPINHKIIWDSWNAMVPHIDEILNHFVEELAQTNASVHTELSKTQINAIQAAVRIGIKHTAEYLDEADHLEDYFRKLGHKHAALGITPENYAQGMNALLNTMAYYFDSSWSSDAKESWSTVLKFAISNMARGHQKYS